MIVKNHPTESKILIIINETNLPKYTHIYPANGAEKAAVKYNKEAINDK